MAIEIKDLPLLEDLTPEQLKELFGAGKFRPEFDALEDRIVQSGVSAAAYLGSASAVYSPSLSSAYTQLAPAPLISAVVAVASGELPAGYEQAYSPGIDLNAKVTPVGFGDVYSPNAGKLSTVVEMPLLGGQFQQQGRIAIENKLVELAKKGISLGRPLAGFEESQQTADQSGRFQAFEKGSIYWSPAIAKLDIDKGLVQSIAGAHVIYSRDILNKFYSRGATRDFGFPKSDQAMLTGPNAAVFSDFYNADSRKTSTIVHTQGIGASVVSGPIRDWWVQHGSGKYGVPVGDQYDVRAGAASPLGQDFLVRDSKGHADNSTIVSSKVAGTHDLRGLIAKTWFNSGTPGDPTTDQTGFDASGKAFTRQVVHFKRSGNDYFAIGASDRGAYFVVGYVYLAWNSIGGEEFGVPIKAEDSFNIYKDYRPVFFSVFVHRNLQGFETEKVIYWSPIRENGGLLSVTIPSIDSHYYVDNGSGYAVVLNFLPKSAPTGFEELPSRTGSTSSPLTADVNGYDPSSAYKSTANAQAPAIYGNLLDPSAAYQSTYQIAPNSPWTDWASLNSLSSGDQVGSVSGDLLQPAMANNANLFGYDDAFALDIDLWQEYTPELGVPSVFNGGDPSFQAASEFSAGDLIAAAGVPANLVGSQMQGVGNLNLLYEALVIQRNDLQPLLNSLGQPLQLAQQDLQATFDVRVQLVSQNEQMQTNLQAAALVLSAADQALAAKSVAFAKAEATLKQTNQSTLVLQAQTAKKTQLQAKVLQASVKYRQALKAQKANHNKRLNAPRRLAVNKAKADLIALNKQLKAQITIVQNADKKMKAEASALKNATAARELARVELDAVRSDRDHAAKNLSDLQTTQGQLANAFVQAQQQMVNAQNHVNQLVGEQAGVKDAVATSSSFAPVSEDVAVAAPAQNETIDSQPDVAALAAQLVAEHSLGAYHPEWTADNWLGRGERWILSTSNEWYFITPDGGLYRYNGSEANSALLATLGQSYWQNLDLLFSAT